MHWMRKWGFMKRVVFNVDEDLFLKLADKANSLGLTNAAYLRQLITSASNFNKEFKDQKLRKLFDAFIVVLAEALGRTQKDVSAEKVKNLIEILKQKFRKELNSEIK